jgi:hypothetical protein
MTDPTFSLRGGQSGPLVKGTPANVLAFNASGEKVGGVPQASGGGSVRLPGTAYVDQNNFQVAPDGSASNPFRAINEACAALALDAAPVSSILVWPGDYSAELAIAWGGGAAVMFAAANDASRMWQGSVPLARLPGFDVGFSSAQFKGLSVGQLSDGFGFGVTLVDCDIRAATPINSGGPVMMSNCFLNAGAVINGQNIRWRDCEMAAGVFTVTGSSMVMQGCIFEGAPTLVSTFGTPANLTIDGWSKALLQTQVPTLTNVVYDLQNAVV